MEKQKKLAMEKQMEKKTAKPTMVIRGRLLWAPQSCPETWTSENFVSLPATQLIDSKAPLYHVPHYSQQALGRAFGPVGLDNVMRFCHQLYKVFLQQLNGLEENEQAKVYVLTTPENNEQMHTNVVTMLGAYLVLRHGWSAKKVKDVLGEAEARRTFSCAWARINRPERKKIHEVYDCWLGIEVAKSLEWIHCAVVTNEQVMNRFCRDYAVLANRYDAAWVVPGRMLVCADPATTAADTNPKTFSEVFPSRSNSVRSSPFASAAGSTTASPYNSMGMSGGRQDSKKPSLMSLSNLMGSLKGTIALDTDSTDTVCKTYDDSMSSELDTNFGDHDPFASNAEVPQDFVTFLKEAGVRCMFRCNFDDEPGMPQGGSYDQGEMLDCGIDHADVIVPDHDGGLPTTHGFRCAHEIASQVLNCEEAPNAVAIHCKGGFGRSIVLCCCLVIEQYDIPGEALLGWVRMARPGAITTPIQENFLKQMTGREAVRKWAEISTTEQQGGQGRCAAGCPVM